MDSKKRLLEQGKYESGKLIRGVAYLWEDNGTCTKIKVLTEMMHEMQSKNG